VEGLAQFVLGLSPAARGRSLYAVLWFIFERLWLTSSTWSSVA